MTEVVNGNADPTVGFDLNHSDESQSEQGNGNENNQQQLNIPRDKPYGRRDELRFLTQALSRCTTGNRSEVVIVQGPPGSGKTTLTNQLRSYVAKTGGCFAVGKFDRLRKNQPGVGIMEALNQICHLLLHNDDLETIRRSLLFKLGGDASFLQALLPSLASVLDADDIEFSPSSLQAFPRLKGACRRFLNAVAAPNRPIVLLFEDLDHAGVGCLQIIRSLITDEISRHVLILGTCRDAEVSKALIPGGEDQWGATRVALDGLSMDAITWMVSDTLRKPYGHVAPLSEFISKKTGGNPYFILHLLQKLWEKSLLVWVPEESHWTFDMDVIHASDEDLGTLLSLVQDKVHQLDSRTQHVLQVAACIGYSFNGNLLKEVIQADTSILSNECKSRSHANDVDAILNLCIDQSMIEIGPTGEFSFVHEMVHELFYNMLVEKRKEKIHYVVGMRIRARASKLESGNTEMDSLTFTTMDHLNRARSILTKPDEMAKISKLNLKAATCAISKSAFVSAIDYLESALNWIGGGNWSSHYNLTLSITNEFAKAYYGIGDADACKKSVDLVAEKARCLEDKLEAYFTLIDSLAAQGKNEAVIEFCLPILQGLGEKFPRKLSKTQMSFEMMKTKRKLKGMSDSAILLIPEMRDAKKISIMGLIVAIGHHAYFLQQREMLFLATMRCIQLTLAHGRAGKTAYVFACYGMVHACMNNYKDAYRFGELAVKLTDITSEKGSMAQTVCIASCFCLHWERNLQELVEPLSRACQVGNECGDIEWAILSSVVLVSASLASGRHLFELEEETRTLCQDMSLYNNHEDTLRICLPLWQGVLNLLSRGKEALTLTGDAMDQHELVEICSKTNNVAALSSVWYVRLQLACYFQSWNVALVMIENLEQSKHFQIGSFSFYHQKFFESLAYIALDRQNMSRKYQSKVAKTVKELKKMFNNGTVSCEPLVLLLEAEVASLQNNKNGLKKAYDEAVAAAEARDMSNIRALANECAGTVFLNYDDYLSDQYLSEALEYYFQWGAMGKVEQLETDHQSLHSKPKVVTSVTSSRGSRTNSTGRRSKGSKGDRPGARGSKGRVVLFKK